MQHFHVRKLSTQFSQKGRLVDLGQRPINALVVQNTHGRFSLEVVLVCSTGSEPIRLLWGYV
ncbi:hypothetical protein D3C78_1960820 [compost metagenome]